ncbi:DUF4157 domain-containing protein [Nordella sp. HKS 07]|uniref:eCIS core domain-containing protein n=1 Tax=Nordella sp. HKS 07 TaxID=2712222 RepID=UPI0013E177D1|nr:DUF4157 domain-containing protein [Nordella sp. HKS 07]QIG47222.1 DUF4157 domain-containing protein [Nordella sp. HKS 07]
MYSFVQEARTDSPSPRAAKTTVQPKLQIGRIDDPLEREADRTADAALAGKPAPGPAASPLAMSQNAPTGVRDVLSSPGRPLDASQRAYFEPRFGHDFSDVRVHSDMGAASSALCLGAAAYTVGPHIAFAAGHFAPGTSAGSRLMAHELAHVVQQRRAGPFIQREPLPEYKSADSVLDLKYVIKPEGEAWQLSVEGDFPTPEAVGRLIWPMRDQIPPGVSIKPLPTFITQVEGWYGEDDKKKKPPVVHRQFANYELTGVALFTLRTMEPSIAKLFADQGLVEESKEVKEARAAFRERRSYFGQPVLDNIDTALSRITRNNPDLLVAYYRAYLSDWKLTDDIARTSGAAGDTDQGLKHPKGYTDINIGVLHREQLPKLSTDDPLSLLGETLIHEFAHKAHARDYLKGPGEGKAYGIESFFAMRLGDKKREEAADDLGTRLGDKLAFNTSFSVMKRLYEVIDTQRSILPSLKNVTPQRAREMVVEFISKNKEDFGDELRKFILAEFDEAAYNSLPSREKN